MISKSLSTSEKRAALHTHAGKLAEFCQAIYPLLVAHADDWGCLQGDVFTVKNLVDPSSPRKLPEFEAALRALHTVGLIVWYQHGDKRYVSITDFGKHQDLKGHTKDGRPRPIPAPYENAPNSALGGEFPPNVPKLPLREEKRTEENRTALRAVTDDAFTAFWFAYPKKKSRSDAERAWRKLAPSPELSQRIQDAIAAQRVTEDWTKDGGKYIPYPASWLNARRWEDEDVTLTPAVAGRQAPSADQTSAYLAALRREKAEAARG